MHLACARAGAVLVNVNPAYRTHELAFTLQKSRMKVLFLWERDSRAEYAQILDEARSGKQLSLEHAICFGTDRWDELLTATAEIQCEPRLSPTMSPTFSTPREPRASPRA